MTDRTDALLVCIYYRVAAGDAQRVISGVREFQRTLQGSGHADEAQVLLRCALPFPDPSPPLPDARTASPHASPPPPAPEREEDATVMETYRVRRPAAGAPADAAVRALLARVDRDFAPWAGLLRGARHVEVFVPCA